MSAAPALSPAPAPAFGRLVGDELQLEECVSAVRAVVKPAHASACFRSEALGLARRAVNVI